jgi:hypothetical protein
MDTFSGKAVISGNAPARNRSRKGRRGWRVGVLVLLALVLVGSVVAPGGGAAARLRRYQQQDSTYQTGDSGSPDGIAITDPSYPFQFTRVGRIVSIQKVTITLTINSGNTAPGQFDEDNLVLALDGVDTGIKLNGFGSAFDTLTISGVPNHGAELLKQLKADGTLAATIVDRTPGDGYVIIYDATQTTLTIAGKRR